MQQQQYTLDVLNRLYAAERKSLLPRLAEMDVFVDASLAGDAGQVRRIAAEQARHEEWLLEAAAACGGGLCPVAADVFSSNLHYCDLSVLLPRVIAGEQSVVQAYGREMAEVKSFVPQAAEVIARIHNRHQVYLEQLRAIQSRLQAVGKA